GFFPHLRRTEKNEREGKRRPKGEKELSQRRLRHPPPATAIEKRRSGHVRFFLDGDEIEEIRRRRGEEDSDADNPLR
ncbi:hypothetical protein U1Q18_037784, partial [Sarracenia purpurea var. burkii]